MSSTFVYDESHHLTGFEMLFPDGEIKQCFTLTSVQTLTDREIRTDHLRRSGQLREGTDFAVFNANDLPDTVPNWDSMRGTRTVLSTSGLMLLVMMTGRTDFSNRLRYWLVDEVIPGILRDGYYRASDIDSIVAELRGEIEMLKLRDLGWGDMTLGDLAGWDG